MRNCNHNHICQTVENHSITKWVFECSSWLINPLTRSHGLWMHSIFGTIHSIISNTQAYLMIILFPFKSNVVCTVAHVSSCNLTTNKGVKNKKNLAIASQPERQRNQTHSMIVVFATTGTASPYPLSRDALINLYLVSYLKRSDLIIVSEQINILYYYPHDARFCLLGDQIAKIQENHKCCASCSFSN